MVEVLTVGKHFGTSDHQNSQIEHTCWNVRYVRSKQKVRDRIGALKNDKGETVESLQETANLLNRYFSSAFTKERLDNTPEQGESKRKRLS